jgi:hypothetical protein
MIDQPFPMIPERLPGRLNPAQSANLLGFQPHDIPILVEARLLKPLGNPRPHSVRFFCATEIQELALNRQWLGKATNAIYQHWFLKSEARQNASNFPEIKTSGPLECG